MDIYFSTQGQPTGIVFDKQGSSFIADQGHQAILCHEIIENMSEMAPVIKDNDGKPLRGPHSMVLSEKNHTLYFTDCGPQGESCLESPTGSIFAIDLNENMLKPIIDSRLSQPTGMVMSNDQNKIFVCETG